VERLEQKPVFAERLVDGVAPAFPVPAALRVLAVEVLGTCRIPFDQADRGVMLLLDRAEGDLVVIGEFGVYGAKIVGRVVPVGGGPLECAIRERRALDVRNGNAAGRSGSSDPVEAALASERVALAPMADDSSCVGILALLGGRNAMFTEADLSRLARKAKYACRDLRLLLGRIDVSDWYDDVSERLDPSILTQQDVHVLLQAFGHDFTTANADLARVLSADVGEALKGLGLRARGRDIGAAGRYSADEVQTLLKAFGVEITIGRGEVGNLLTMDVHDLVGRPGGRAKEDGRRDGA